MRVLWADDPGDGADLPQLRRGKQEGEADGTRTVRYEGDDEAYAVNELYLKINERVSEQKKHMAPKRAAAPIKTGNIAIKFFVFQMFAIVLGAVIALSGWFDSGPSERE